MGLTPFFAIRLFFITQISDNNRFPHDNLYTINMPKTLSESSRIRLDDTWKKYLLNEFQQPYMQQLRAFLVAEKQAGKIIYPENNDYFQAFNLTPFDQVKVVILGQDPYHGAGQAHGLCFSVLPTVAPPPSLINIFKALQLDLNIPIPSHGYLTAWAEQGVLLLNSVLTVEQGKAASHKQKGWEIFTDKVIQVLNQSAKHLVFLLWGSYAQKKAAFVDKQRHLVLTSPHPSPLSAHRGFLACHHFSKTNQYLQENNKSPINWQLPASAN